jgi:mannose-6-phosphate isomerase-like protein (cupin superfamily)
MPTAGVRHWTVVLQPGDALNYLAEDWVDALVVVRSGELQVQCHSGRRARFGAGAVLTMAGLPVRRLRNPGQQPLVLHAVARLR